MQRVEIQNEHDIVLARTAVRDIAGQEEFSIMSKTRIATAVSELARNVFLHGEGGYLEYEVIRERNKTGVRCVFIDQGPGITDIEQAMAEGFTTTATMGHGLPGTRRLVDEFNIKSEAGQGVWIEIIKWN